MASVLGQVGVSFLKGATGGSGVFYCFWFKYIPLRRLFCTTIILDCGYTTTLFGEYMLFIAVVAYYK